MDFVCKLYGNTYAVHVTVALVGVATIETLRFLTFRFTHTQTSALASNRSCWQKHKRVNYKIMEIEAKTILNVKTLLMFV